MNRISKVDNIKQLNINSEKKFSEIAAVQIKMQTNVWLMQDRLQIQAQDINHHNTVSIMEFPVISNWNKPLLQDEHSVLQTLVVHAVTK